MTLFSKADPPLSALLYDLKYNKKTTNNNYRL